MKKYTKRGFTIVELVIVIAIVAILAGVLIPTFGTLIKKATISSDTQLVKNLNTILSVNEATDGKNVTPTDAINDVYEGGYRIEKLTPTTRGYDIMWDSVNDKFVLLDDSTTNKAVIYGTNETKNLINDSTNRYKLFAIRNKDKLTDVTDYSIYLTGEGTIDSLDVTKGIDVGKNTVKEIEYTNTSSAQNVIIRTNGGTLTIDALTDTVRHYGTTETVTIDHIAQSSYYENGTTAVINLKDGHVEIESNGFVNQIDVTGATGTVKATVNGILGTAAPAALTTQGSGIIGFDSTTIIKVDTAEKLQALAYACNMGTTFEGKTIELTDDIDLTGKVWTPFGEITNKSIEEGTLANSHLFKGNINGNNHKIIGLSNAGYTGYFLELGRKSAIGVPFGLITAASGNVTISDLTIEAEINNVEGSRVAAFVAIYVDTIEDGSLTFNNCHAKGNIDGKEKAAGFIGTNYVTSKTEYQMKCSFTFNNCTNEANITGNRSGGFIGTATVYGGNGEIVFSNCQNTRIIKDNKESNFANGGFIGFCGSGKISFDSLCTSTKPEVYPNGHDTHEYIGYFNGGTAAGDSSVYYFFEIKYNGVTKYYKGDSNVCPAKYGWD